MSMWSDYCLHVHWEENTDEFTVDKAWIAGAFFLGLVIGGGITFLLVPICLRDWEKKKRQDDEETMLVELERENTMTATQGVNKKNNGDKEFGDDQPKKSKLKAIGSFFSRKGKNTTSTSTDTPKQTGWVNSENDGNKPELPETASVGMVTVLTKQTSGDADAEMTRQDMDEVRAMDIKQKQAKDDMMLKMLKIKLRKMKAKGQGHDPYLADFTQKIIDNRRGNDEIINQEGQEGQAELKKKHGKNAAALESELDNLQIRLDAKRRQMDKEELENVRTELLRTSGLTESEVDDMMEKLKQNLADLERRQGLEQARQARHLAERLEKRRQILEFRKLQEQQDKDSIVNEVKSFEEPLGKLIDDGKLQERQKKEILDEHKKNLENLQKQHELDQMRSQSELAEKLRQRRETRMKKLADKQLKEKSNFLEKAEKGSNTDEFVNNYQNLLQHQQQETEATQTDLDQTEIQEMEKASQLMQSKKDVSVKEASDKMVQTIAQQAQLADVDVKRIIKLHNLRMDAVENQRKEEREQMRASLQEKWQQRMLNLQQKEKTDQTERETILEQQDLTVKQVLNSNLELSEDAKEKIMREHERNMVALNNQLSRSKLKQQMSLEHKLSARRARLSELQAQKRAAESEVGQQNEKEIRRLQEKLDQEVLLFEKEKKEAENNFRKRLALETEAALAQQEAQLAALIGRLEVGHARRMAVLQQQDKTIQELQKQLEGGYESGKLSTNNADQIIQQHYNQVEHVNETMQNNRQRQEQMINEKIQAKKLYKQRELEDQLQREQQEMIMARRQAGAGIASNILNNALMAQRQKKAMEELEREMQIELERNREKLNNELQKSLEKELEAHKGEFLNQLANASKISKHQVQQGMQKANTSLGVMEEDSDSDGNRRPQSYRPNSSSGYARGDAAPSPTKTKKKKKSLVPAPKPAFQTSTGEQIHGTWDLDDSDGF